MNANIFRYEFNERLHSVLIWSAVFVLLILFIYSLFPAFADKAVLMNEMLARFPQQLKDAFGLSNMDLASALGYFSFLFLFVQLCLAIQAANYGFGMVSIEETELTADFLLSKPVSRAEVLSSKLLAAFASLSITNLVVWVSSFTALKLFSDGQAYESKTLVLLLTSIILFQLFFFSVGLLISLLVKRIRSVTPYSLGLGFGMYIMNAFIGIFDEVAMELITPFNHFDAARVVKFGELDTPLVLLNTAFSLICLGTSYLLYMKRDIPAVS